MMKYKTIEIRHSEAGIVTDVLGDGKSLLDHHIMKISYEALPKGPAQLDITFRLVAPKVVIKGVPEKNVWVEAEE